MKFTQYDELAEVPHDDDVFLMVDVSDTTMSAGGTTKRVKKSNISSGGGSIPYNADVVIDASGGGDYTNLATGLNALTANQVCFIVAGNYTLDADVALNVNNLVIIGDNAEDTKINLVAYDITGSGTNIKFNSVSFVSTSTGTGGYVTAGTRWIFDSCIFNFNQGATSVNHLRFNGSNSVWRNGRLVQTAGSGSTQACIYLSGSNNSITNNYIEVILNNSTYGFIHNPSGSNNSTINNNYFCNINGTGAQRCIKIDGNFTQVNSNSFYDPYFDMEAVLVTSNANNWVVSGNTFNCKYGLNNDNSSHDGVITNNTFLGSSDNPIRVPASLRIVCSNNFVKDGTIGINFVNSEDSVITGNIINSPSSYAIDVSSSRRNIVKNNSCYDVGGASAIYTASSSALTKYDNYEDDKPTPDVKTTLFMNNTGSTIPKGAVVVMDYATGENNVKTTTTASDGMVVGVVTTNLTDIANGAFCPVVTSGMTRDLKVDGTVDIAIGDYLTTSTTAGVAVKANSGDVAFAIAREAYTADDSNGVIDAIVIEKIVVPSDTVKDFMAASLSSSPAYSGTNTIVFNRADKSPTEGTFATGTGIYTASATGAGWYRVTFVLVISSDTARIDGHVWFTGTGASGRDILFQNITGAGGYRVSGSTVGYIPNSGTIYLEVYTGASITFTGGSLGNDICKMSIEKIV